MDPVNPSPACGGGAATLRRLLLGLGALLVVFLHVRQSEQAPYYFAWDSTFVYGRDAMLVAGGELPEHTLHPNLGNLLVHGVTLRIGKRLGWISAATMRETLESLNPYPVFAESIEYLLHQGLWFNLGSILLLWLTFRRLFNLPAGWWRTGYDLVFLGLFGLMPFLAFWSLWIRSEGYGFFFVCAALCCTVHAALSSHRRMSLALVAGAGFLSGLAYLSKINLVGHVLILPLAYVAFAGDRASTPCVEGEKRLWRVALISLLLATAGLVVSLWALIHYGGRIPQVATWAPAFYFFGGGPLSFHPAYVVLAGLFLQGVVFVFCFARLTPQARWLWLSLAVFTVFFLGAFLAHFAMYADTRTAAVHLLHTLDGSLWRLFGKDSTTGLPPVERSFVFAYGSLALLIVTRALGWITLSWRQVVTTAAIVVLAAVYAYGAARSPYELKEATLRQGIAFLSLALVAGQIIRNTAVQRRTLLLTVMLLFLTLPAGWAFVQWRDQERHLYWESYNYDVHMWRKGHTYGLRGAPYVEQMRMRYGNPDQWAAAFALSLEPKAPLRVLLRQVFVGRHLDLCATSQLVKGNPVWLRDQIWRVEELPDAWQGAITVDPTGPIPPAGQDRLAPRADYALYVLLPPARKGEWLQREGVRETGQAVRLTRPSENGEPGVQTVRLEALHVMQSSALAEGMLNGQVLFVLRRLSDSEPVQHP